jgi:PKD repeat protein
LAPLTVRFADTSTGTITAFAWDFGNGVTSTFRNVNRTYALPGTYTVVLTVTGPGGSDVETKAAYITVWDPATNQAPVATILSPAGNVTIATGTTVNFQGTATDPDNNLPLRYAWNLGGAAPATNQQNPSVQFNTPGTFRIILRASDAKGILNSNPPSVTVTVTTPPIAAADSYTIQAGKTLSIAAAGVLANDTSPSGKPLTALLATTTANGTLSLASTGAFTFTPAAGYSGSTTFSYRASDGISASAPALVTIAVTPAAVPGLVAAYGFNEGSGTTVADLSGRSNTGTISGATWVAIGRFGKALSFNGTSSWVTVNDAPSLDLTTGMTLEAWVYPQGSLAGWRSIVMKEQPGTDVYYIESLDGKAVGDVYVAGSTHHIYAATAMPLNVWTHLATTYDGANLRLYANGVQVASQALTGIIQTSTSPLRIGGNSMWGEYFQGLIDEVRVYNRALSPTEIQLDMHTAVQ